MFICAGKKYRKDKEKSIGNGNSMRYIGRPMKMVMPID